MYAKEAQESYAYHDLMFQLDVLNDLYPDNYGVLFEGRDKPVTLTCDGRWAKPKSFKDIESVLIHIEQLLNADVG